MPIALPTIVVDTREKLPWSFEPDVASVVVKGLPAGDYSLEGHEWNVAVERKSLDDFVSTVLYDRIRFKKELRRLGGYRMACIAVEADVKDVLDRKYQSEAHPNSILAFAHAIFLDYGVPVFFWGARPMARHMAERFLLLAHKRENHVSD